MLRSGESVNREVSNLWQSEKFSNLIHSFVRLTEQRLRNLPEDTVINTRKSIDGKKSWINIITNSGNSFDIEVPKPFVENGVVFIENGRVKRALSDYYIVSEDKRIDYIDVLYRIMCDHPEGLIPKPSVSIFPQLIANGVEYGNISIVVYKLQKAINWIVNLMPLHSTYMNSFIMNRRIIFVDKEFDEIKNGDDLIAYQVAKNKKFFERGWSSSGIADGALVYNHILDIDARRTIPFGIRSHNPGRNLYSTFGMSGKETPYVMSNTEYELHRHGITRGGYNLFTLFIDMPETFEDQILVDSSVADKLVYTGHKRIQTFGDPEVRPGDVISYGQVVAKTNGQCKRFAVNCDSAIVEEITESEDSVGGHAQIVYNIVVRYEIGLRDALKLTNRAANKGVVHVENLGYATNPVTGERRRVEVIVSSRSVKKRQNGTQLIEGIFGLIHENNDDICVTPDDLFVSEKDLERMLEANNMPKNGMWSCTSDYIANELTKHGIEKDNVSGVAGIVFWGVISTAEAHFWKYGKTIDENSCGIRSSGLKLSSIEMASLAVRFGGFDNPVIREIMGHRQGSFLITEHMKMISCRRNMFPDLRLVDIESIRCVDQTNSVFVQPSAMINTIVDPKMYKNGAILRLPLPYQIDTVHNDSGVDVLYEGKVIGKIYVPENMRERKHVSETIDKLYIPKPEIRECWKHETGLVGLNTLGVILNNIIFSYNRYKKTGDEKVLSMYYSNIRLYFKYAADALTSKSGHINTYGMSVRYPVSIKAAATTSSKLPYKTVEIHKDSARYLSVSDGDVAIFERFPCLGITTITTAMVKVTDDPQCRYTIRVGGNDFGGAGLDFDGDTIYLISLHTAEAKKALREAHLRPHRLCRQVEYKHNLHMGIPEFVEMSLQDYKLGMFKDLTAETNAKFIEMLTSVKAKTGAATAFGYNMLRLTERLIFDKRGFNILPDLMSTIDKTINSIMKQKHGFESNDDDIKRAICTCDVDFLIKFGMSADAANYLTETIKTKAFELLGVMPSELVADYEAAEERGSGNIVNRIVQANHPMYFASRAKVDADMLLHLMDRSKKGVNDIPSKTIVEHMKKRINLAAGLGSQRAMLNTVRRTCVFAKGDKFYMTTKSKIAELCKS